MPLSPGDILSGHYRIEVEIGHGAYGRVYRGRDTKLDRPVAIKELAKGADDLGSSQFADYVRRFEREARVQAGFNHPNIVHVYELIQESADRLYLVMEYVDGESLRDQLVRRGPLPIDEAVHITSDILAGLAVVHADPRDIVHRDIKPSNVLLTKSGQAKLADFGLAQVGDESMRSGAGQPHPGTPAYMSPEQEQTNAYLYPASDLFSVGCVLFEMLTGMPYKRAKKERKGLAELRPDAPPWLVEVTATALAKDPDERPKDGAEMGRLLAETRGKVEAEERARQEARRKVEEDTERARLAEQERQKQEAAERARIAAELQAQVETPRKASEEVQRCRQAEEAERKAQAELQAARGEKREQAWQEYAERSQQEAKAHTARRQKSTLWMVWIMVGLLLVMIVWQPWVGGIRLGAAPTAVFTPLIATRPVPQLTDTRQPTRASESTKATTPLGTDYRPDRRAAGADSESTKATTPLGTPAATAQGVDQNSMSDITANNARMLSELMSQDIYGRDITWVQGSSQFAMNTWNAGAEDYFGTWVSFFDSETFEEIRRIEAPGEIADFALSADKQMLAVGSRIGATVNLLNSQDGSVIRTLDVTGDQPDVAFSPDGLILATGGYGRAARLWSTKDGSLLRTLDDTADGGISACFSSDGKVVATRNRNDGATKLWETSSGRLLLSLDDGYTQDAVFSPDDARLAVAYVNGTVGVYDTKNGQRLHELRSNTEEVYDVAWSLTGQVLASGGKGGGISLWNSITGELLNTLDSSRYVSDLVFSPDGKLLLGVTSSEGGWRIQVWGTAIP